MNASLARATCENPYRAHTATCPLRMVASRVVCPRAVLQSKTKSLSVAPAPDFSLRGSSRGSTEIVQSPPPPSPSPPSPEAVSPSPSVASSPPYPPVGVGAPASPSMAMQIDGCGALRRTCSTSASLAAIRCCNRNQSYTCFNSICSASLHDNYHTPVTGSFNGSASTFAEASNECEAQGARLCTESELEDGVCCGSGCGHDARYVWSQLRRTRTLDSTEKSATGRAIPACSPHALPRFPKKPPQP
mmetsp:Transcript_11468/g.28633  ORF Transcript_11468/g.28633 Transcript_11468/m.28633 type:complete len:246 (-) Transcript_11468:411-1148(-)